MFSHLMKYAYKQLFQDKGNLIFGMLLPLGLGIIYLFAFEGLAAPQDLEPATAAIIFDGSSNEIAQAKQSITAIAKPATIENQILVPVDKEADSLIHYTTATLEEAQHLMDEQIVQSIIHLNNTDNQMNISIQFAPETVNDISSGVIYAALSNYQIINTNISNTLPQVSNPLQFGISINQLLQNAEVPIVQSAQTANVNSQSIYFYAILGYVCFFFMTSGMYIVRMHDADYSAASARLTISPLSRIKRFTVTFIISIIPSLLIVYLLLAIYWLRDIPIGNDIPRTILLMTLGTLVGYLFGIAIASIFKLNEGIISALSTAVPLFFGALSGMMAAPVKAFITNNYPFLNKINPVALVTDGLYYLNFYPSTRQYNQNIAILLVYIVILLIIAIFGLRRVNHENI